MYSCSPTLTQNFIEKFRKESVFFFSFFFFKFWSHDYLRENENLFFGYHFKTEHFLNVLFADCGFQVHTDMV